MFVAAKGAANHAVGGTIMAQQKTSTHTNADQPRDEDGRFTDKDDAQRSPGRAANGSKSKVGDRKSASSGGRSNDSSNKSSRGGSTDQRAKSR
jgi:hypothetical protein